MIRHSEKNSKKKNYTTLREKIIALVAEHARYPRDLYDACARGSTLTRSEFHDLLDEMNSDGDIHINANHLVMLPEPPAETKPSSAEPPAPTNEKEILIHCLVNRSLVLKHPKQKKHLNNRYYVCFWAVH